MALITLVPTGARSTDFAKYHSYAELSSALHDLASTHSDIAKLASIGKTKEGREIWALELGNRKGIPVDQRPGLLITANLEGDHLIGSELALYIADYLLGAYDSDQMVKQRLDSHVVYILPRINADGAELMFSAVKSGRKTNTTSIDADNDGRLDEDGPEDINKDGIITLMRAKDPKGLYMIHPEDPRLMKKADPAKGESGIYSIYWEGLDHDGDGFIAEDGPGGVDINRNFMHQYPYFAPDAGHYMVSEPETRAVLEFVLQHRNIALALCFAESDNLIMPPTRRGELAPANTINLFDYADKSFAEAKKVGIFQESPTGFGRGMRMFMGEFEGVPGGSGRSSQPQTPSRGIPARTAATTVNSSDLEFFTSVSNKYRELTGIRNPGATRTPAGSFFEYGYFQYGIPSFCTPGWGLPGVSRQTTAAATNSEGSRPQADSPRPFGGQTPGAGPRGRSTTSTNPSAAEAEGAASEGIDLRILQWMDADKIDGFMPWTPFTHPTLGQVEIGGFKPYAVVNPPASKIAELGAGHAKFVLHITGLYSNIKIAKTEVKNLGGGIYQIKAEIENSGLFPTALAQGVVSRAVKPVMVQIGVIPDSIITGNEKTSHIPALAGSGNRQSFQWVIRGTPGSSITLKAVSQKSGQDAAILTLP
jgi:hypothetical protein